MKLANATNLNRKFGKPRDLQSPLPNIECLWRNRHGCKARTRISCHAAPERTACAPFHEERRMKLTESHQVPQEIRGRAGRQT